MTVIVVLCSVLYADFTSSNKGKSSKSLIPNVPITTLSTTPGIGRGSIRLRIISLVEIPTNFENTSRRILLRIHFGYSFSFWPFESFSQNSRIFKVDSFSIFHHLVFPFFWLMFLELLEIFTKMALKW